MDLRILTYNINGIRSAIRKGLPEWLQTDPADIICLQELKAQESDIDKNVLENSDYHSYFFTAEKKGYSGVAILSHQIPDYIEYGHDKGQSDREGRVMRADFSDLSIISAYFPSGTSGEMRQAYKYEWLDNFFDYLKELRETRKKLIICGDYNIAHKEIDIHNPKANKKSSGFLPEERAWMDKFFENGFVDGFREINKQPGQYTWWYQLRKSLRIENKGWRIDYISITQNLKENIISASIHPEVRHSDHCPVFLSIKI